MLLSSGSPSPSPSPSSTSTGSTSSVAAAALSLPAAPAAAAAALAGVASAMLKMSGGGPQAVLREGCASTRPATEVGVWNSLRRLLASVFSTWRSISAMASFFFSSSDTCLMGKLCTTTPLSNPHTHSPTASMLSHTSALMRPHTRSAPRLVMCTLSTTADTLWFPSCSSSSLSSRSTMNSCRCSLSRDCTCSLCVSASWSFCRSSDTALRVWFFMEACTASSTSRSSRSLETRKVGSSSPS
mmetsp:Transcript_4760/g.11095  ORF Transcript_4760/g.11095 Transcript_4760/m.11095 type:complete len:242 (-) Transcript_4760:478-1203(-)